VTAPHVRHLRGDRLRRGHGLRHIHRAHGRDHGAARARRVRRDHPRTGRPRPPAPEDHRPVGGRGAALRGRRHRPDARLQRLHLQLPRPARGASGQGPPLLLHRRHRGDRQGLGGVGAGLRGALPRHVRLRDPRARHRPRRAGARPLRHQAAVLRRERGAPALRLHGAGAARGGRGGHVDRPGGAPPLHVLARGRPAAAHHPDGRAQAAPRHDPHRRARRADGGPRLLDQPLRPHGRGRAPADGGVEGHGAGRAAHRGAPAHGGRRAGRRAAVRRRGQLADRRPARRGGAGGPRHLLHRVRGGERRDGGRVRLFRPYRAALRHRPPQDLHPLVGDAGHPAARHRRDDRAYGELRRDRVLPAVAGGVEDH